MGHSGSSGAAGSGGDDGGGDVVHPWSDPCAHN